MLKYVVPTLIVALLFTLGVFGLCEGITYYYHATRGTYWYEPWTPMPVPILLMAFSWIVLMVMAHIPSGDKDD